MKKELKCRSKCRKVHNFCLNSENVLKKDNRTQWPLIGQFKNFLLGCLWQSSRKMGRLLFLLGCLWQTQSRSAFCLFVFFFFLFFLFFSFFFSVSVKVLPVTPLVSGVFVHRAFCAYFLRIERVVELRRFLWWTQ